MPELPEVETIRLGLTAQLVGDRISTIDVRDSRLMDVRQAKRWQTTVPGLRWNGFDRRGKYLVVILEAGYRLVFHLRMTGQLIVREKPGTDRYRLRLHFASRRVLDFCDQRRFGEAWLLAPGDPFPSKTVLGPDALTELTRETFIALVKGRTTRIHPLLIDQKALAGVGNIYAQEALFKALIRPSRPACRVTRLEASALFDTLQETLQTAIQHRGSSNRNYLDAEGKSGSAQTLHTVYRKAGRPCPRCQSPLRAHRVGGRGTVYCATCQK
jgi:formamidopyrimidine-DNA glycosylase